MDGWNLAREAEELREAKRLQNRREDIISKVLDSLPVSYCSTRTFSRLINTVHGTVKVIGQAPIGYSWKQWCHADASEKRGF